MEPGIDKTFFLLVVDTIVLVLQTLLYYVCLDEQEYPHEKSVLKWKFWSLLIGYVPKTHFKPATDAKAFEDEPLVI